MVQTTRLQLPLIAAAQAQKHVTHNEAILRLDGLCQMQAVSYTVSAQPASPADGDLYLLPAGKTGAAWGAAANHAAAHYYDGVWHFYAPHAGWLAFIADTSRLVYHNGTQWTDVLTPSGASAADGSASAPGFAFASDTNTGLYRIGTDNPALAAGGTKLFDWKAAGNTQPLQPSFFAYLSANQSSKTGDGTTFDVPFDTESFDRGANHDSASTKGLFTVPVTGLYQLGGVFRLSNLGAGHTQFEAQIVATGGTYNLAVFNPQGILAAGGLFYYCGSILIAMTAGDTAKLRTTVYNSTKTVQIDGGSASKTSFWGFLVA